MQDNSLVILDMGKHINTIFFIVFYFVFFSCEKSAFLPNTNHGIKNSQLECTVINPMTKVETPPSDPYAFQNVNSVFQIFVADNVDKKIITPTHKVILVYPASLEELRELERDERLFVDYIPFDHVRSNDVSTDFAYDLDFLSFDPDDTISDCEMNTNRCEVFDISPLYVVWPNSIAIPENLQWIFLYDVYLPYSDSENIVFDTYLQKSISNNTSDEPAWDNTRAGTTFRGRISFWDSFLGEYIYVQGLKVRVQLGSSHQDFYTDHLGYVDIPTAIPHSATLSYILQTEQFTVADSTSTLPVIKTFGTLNDLWGNNTFPYYVLNLPVGNSFAESIYRGAKYLYDRALITSDFFDMFDGLIIHAITDDSSTNLGEYYYSTKQIKIFYKTTHNHYSHYPQNVISTTLHEMGHSIHHCTLDGENGYNNYTSVKRIIRESFASFIGWYYGERYYLTKGYVKAGEWEHINLNHRQNWSPTDTTLYSRYSPIFIDLIDNYNQPNLNDGISGVPISFIKDVMSSSVTLTDVIDAYLYFGFNNHCYSSFETYLQDYISWNELPNEYNN